MKSEINEVAQWCGMISLILLTTVVGLVKSSVQCPQGCVCTTGTVNTDSLQIQCQGLTQLPQHLPYASSYRLLLANNYIQEVSPRPYLSSTDLLDVTNNRVKAVSRLALTQLTHSVRYLYLQRNKLHCLPVNSLDRLHLNDITLADNPWSCDCLKALASVIDISIQSVNCQHDNATQYLVSLWLPHFTPWSFSSWYLFPVQQFSLIGPFNHTYLHIHSYKIFYGNPNYNNRKTITNTKMLRKIYKYFKVQVLQQIDKNSVEQFYLDGWRKSKIINVMGEKC